MERETDQTWTRHHWQKLQSTKIERERGGERGSGYRHKEGVGRWRSVERGTERGKEAGERERESERERERDARLTANSYLKNKVEYHPQREQMSSGQMDSIEPLSVEPWWVWRERGRERERERGGGDGRGGERGGEIDRDNEKVMRKKGVFSLAFNLYFIF